MAEKSSRLLTRASRGPGGSTAVFRMPDGARLGTNGVYLILGMMIISALEPR